MTSNRLRPPTLLAKMAATVDHVSRGRVVLGIGAGGSRVADASAFELVRREFEAYGVEILAAAEAVEALDEACRIVKLMWTEREPFDFQGRHYRLRDVISEPKPVQRPRPPIMIGAGGEKRALRVVAEQADIWNGPARTADEFRHKSRVLDEHCRAVGRDPRAIERSVQVIASRDDPEDARRRLAEFVEAGCTHLVVAPRPPYPPGTAAWVAEEIVEPVRSRSVESGILRRPW